MTDDDEMWILFRVGACLALAAEADEVELVAYVFDDGISGFRYRGDGAVRWHAALMANEHAISLALHASMDVAQDTLAIANCRTDAERRVLKLGIQRRLGLL